MDLRSLAVLSLREGMISSDSSSSRSFSQMQALQVLDVSDTDMGNAELAQLQPLSRLRELRLTWTKVSRLPLVASLTSLEMGNVEVKPPSPERNADVVYKAELSTEVLLVCPPPSQMQRHLRLQEEAYRLA